jgi:hypothetical protein
MDLETDPDTYILSAKILSVYPPDLVKNLLQKPEIGIFQAHEPQYQYMVYQRRELDINLQTSKSYSNYSDAEVNVIVITSIILVVLLALLAFFIWPVWIPL